MTSPRNWLEFCWRFPCAFGLPHWSPDSSTRSSLCSVRLRTLPSPQFQRHNSAQFHRATPKNRVAIRMSFKLPSMREFDSGLSKLLPKIQTTPLFFLFFTGCLGSPALHSLFLLSSLLTWWLFEAREEPFHNSRYPLTYSLNIWTEAFEFKFHVFFVSIFMNDVELKPAWWKGSSSMVIHEVLGWNKVHPRDIIYTCTSSIKWISFTHYLFVLALMSSLVNFQWMKFHWWICTKFYGWKIEHSWNKIHPWNHGC
jgi:hypothetical protein